MPFPRKALGALDAPTKGGLLGHFIGFCNGIGYQLDLFFQVLLRLRSVPARRALIANQIYQSSIQGLHVVLLVGLFMGMIVALQMGIELSRIGQQDQIGTIVAVTMAREMGPFVTATILAATAGSSMAA